MSAQVITPQATDLPRNSSRPVSTASHLAVLSRLVLLGYEENFEQPKSDLHFLGSDLAYVRELDEQSRQEFLRLANIHHVTVRALQVVERAGYERGDSELRFWAETVLEGERSRIQHATRFLKRVCGALETASVPVTVIKSLEHWPDLGSDLDLYSTARASSIVRLMQEKFDARLEPRSWGDRLANKWNFSIPGLPELIEVHVRYLGQTGEHRSLARRIMEKRVTKIIDGMEFKVPAPEDRVILSTLQRMYRHFYFRLCDMADFWMLLRNRAIDFGELKKSAEVGGIWRGVATFLLLVSEYVKSFGGDVEVPREVLAAAHSREIRVSVGGDFLRVPKAPAAALYASQLLQAVGRADLRAMSRLPLLPPLAVSALLAYRIAGSDKGVW